MWGWVAAGVAKTVAREVAGGRRTEGVAIERATSPRPVRFVVPGWVAVCAGSFLAAAVLGVVAQVLRLAGGRATSGDATVGSIVAAVLCGLPGVGLAIYAAAIGRKKQHLRVVQTLAARPGGVTLGELATALRIDAGAARAIAEDAIRDEHVLGRIEDDRLVTA